MARRVYSLTLVATGKIVAMSVSEWRADGARKMPRRVYSLTLVATGKIVAMSVSEWSGEWRAQDGTAGLLAHARSYGFTSLPHSLL